MPLREQPAAVDQLCAACSNIIESLPEIAGDKIERGIHAGERGRIHHDDFSHVLSAARHGCYLCLSLILESETYDGESAELFGVYTIAVAYQELGIFGPRASFNLFLCIPKRGSGIDNHLEVKFAVSATESGMVTLPNPCTWGHILD